MKFVFWIFGFVMVLPIAWFGLKVILTYFVPAEKSGRELLKRKLRALGIDVSRIPESALNDIVERKIVHAKVIASTSNQQHERNWRANLVRSIETEVQIVSWILSGERAHGLEDSPLWKILVQYGALGKELPSKS